jgi:hypothetical protein
LRGLPTSFCGARTVSRSASLQPQPRRAYATRLHREATNIIHEMSDGRQPKDRIFINVVHAVDGAWNFNGRAMTNAEIGAEVAKAG